MTQNEKEEKGPVSKDEIQFITAQKSERNNNTAHMNHLGVLPGGWGWQAIIIFEMEMVVGESEREMFNLNPSSHKDEKMPPIR